MPAIAVLGTLDTKGRELQLLKENIEQRGHQTLVIDLGVLQPPLFSPDVSREEVARAAGETIERLTQTADRGSAVTAMTRGIAKLAPDLYAQGRFQAMIAMGGSAGTTMATAAMRALPLGVPKVMVSTVAGGDVKRFVDIKDIVMIPAIVDVSGLNRISRQVIAQAAGAVCGMLDAAIPAALDLPLVTASMFGNTTPCVETARAELEREGYEVLVFHATGTGGRTMESLIQAGYISGVLDVTTTEWADELVGGVLGAGPSRLEAAARCGVPAVVAPGCLDMVNFWAAGTVPSHFSHRRFYRHNPNVTLMRTTPDENARLGRILAQKLNLSVGPVVVYLPLRGVSALSAPGGPFNFPEADQALFAELKQNLRSDISVVEIEANINDEVFALALATGLLRLLRSKKAEPPLRKGLP